MFSVTNVNQTGNEVAGDLVAGGKYVTVLPAPRSPLEALYERYRAAAEHAPAQIADQLQHYCDVATDIDVRGLEEKLRSSNRTDQLRQASKLKEDAGKLIMKWQTSGVAQDIITVVLSTIYLNFTLEVTPAIEAGEPRTVIDSLINQKVIAPVTQMLGDNDLLLTPSDILGLLYFLGGNCHIRWDKC